MKQIEEDPWLALPVKYPAGTKLPGVVRNLTSFGAFVEIEAGIDGLVHVSDMSWTKRVEHPSEVVAKGQEVDVMVLDVDAENKRISLGVKQLTEDPWPSIAERFSPGVEPEGNVARLDERGVVVDLGDEIEGLIPASGAGADDPERLDEYYGVGDALSLRVTEADTSNRRIVLEVTDVPTRKTQDEIEAARISAVEEAAATAAAQTAAEAEGDDDDFRLRPGRKVDAVEEEVEVTPAPAAERAAEVQARAAAEAAGSDTEEGQSEEAKAGEPESGDAVESVEEEASAEPDDDAESVEEEASTESDDDAESVEEEASAEPDDDAESVEEEIPTDESSKDDNAEPVEQE
jgi:small subunit ribosomal protein S1